MWKERWTPETEIEEAVELLVQALAAEAGEEAVPLWDALGRVCAENIEAAVPQPPFCRSPLDGYAFRAADLDAAGFVAGAAGVSADGAEMASAGRVLPVSQCIYAGHPPAGPLAPGTAARIMTGAAVPEGADCVVRWEDTDNGKETVEIQTEVRAGDNICFAGEDIQAGAKLIGRGVRLGCAELGILAGQGRQTVRVFARPQAAVLSTGDELTRPGEPLLPGRIYNSNQLMLSARLRELGAEVSVSEQASDDPVRLGREIAELLEKYPIVITTGGVSVGDRDYLSEAASLAGAQLLFHGLNAKPGSPMLAACRAGHVLLALSGNPFAAFSTFELCGHPLVLYLAGREDWRSVRQRAVLADGFPKASHMRRFIRAKLSEGKVHVPGGGHSSGGLCALMGCNCMVDIPAGSGVLEAGDEVEVILL